MDQSKNPAANIDTAVGWCISATGSRNLGLSLLRHEEICPFSEHRLKAILLDKKVEKLC